MRWLAGFFFLLALALVGGYIFVKGYPYRLYSNWIKGLEWNRYYQISNYRASFLKPDAVDDVPLYKEDYVQLWRAFPLRNSLVPLPTRHPLFLTVPLIELKNKSSNPVVGMILSSPNKREISRIYTLPTSYTLDHTQGQELFKLPFVRNRIMQYEPEKLWNEVFTHEIQVASKTLDEMIYDLYILHLRSKILPAQTIKYGLLKEGKALVELASQDKDYRVELILTQDNGRIYSYVLKTEKNSEESNKLRAKYLDAITFTPIDPDMGRLLYTEFKQLNFSRQVDQEGLLYLFSAWSQDMENVEILKEMIFYLERGRSFEQLKALYTYAFKRYGKTFTTKNIFSESNDPNLLLQRKIEIEDIEKRQALEKTALKIPETPELTREEKMKDHLKRAKEEGALESDDMTIH